MWRTIRVPRLTLEGEGDANGIGRCDGGPRRTETWATPLRSFSRNASLERTLPGLRVPHARKTGTTIAGLVFRVSRALGVGGLERRPGIRQALSQQPIPPPPPQDGVILGADTRATNDSVVADKNCEKIHFIAPKI